MSGNPEIDSFIEETQAKSKYCNDFIEWIPIKKFDNVEFLTTGGYSTVYFGDWKLLDNNGNNLDVIDANVNNVNENDKSKKPSKTVIIKVLKNSSIIKDRVLNEVGIYC